MIPDLFSLRGSQNLGRVLSNWIRDYNQSKQRMGRLTFLTPHGNPQFTGYILQQFNIYRSRKAKAWQNWGDQIPKYINDYVISPLDAPDLKKYNLIALLKDFKIGEFKNYHSLIPMAQNALKPIFELTAADGVIGGHHEYVEACRQEFEAIANTITTL